MMKEKCKTLVQILTYSMAAFGFAMLCAYLLVTFSDGKRTYIPMEAIPQVLCYVGGVTLSISLFLTDLVFSSLGERKRIFCFFGLLYVMGMAFFQCFAPIGPFDRISHFFLFSVWILWMSFLCLAVWMVYQCSWDKKYNTSLSAYKAKLERENL